MLLLNADAPLNHTDMIHIQIQRATVALACGLLTACSTTALAPDLAKPDGATTFIRGTAEYLVQSKNEFNDPQALAMRLHYSADLLRNRSAQIDAADKAALVRGVSALLAQPVRFATGGTFSKVPLQGSEDTTARTVLRLGLDLVPGLASVEMTKGLASGAEGLVRADDCPRVQAALVANKRFMDADSGLRRLLASVVVRVAAEGPGTSPEAWRHCIRGLEEDFVPPALLPGLWQQAGNSSYLNGLVIVTQDVLGGMLVRPRSAFGPSDRVVINELENAIVQQARGASQARQTLQAFFPISFAQVEPAESLASPGIHANMARRARALDVARAVLAAAPAATEPVVDLGNGFKTFNPAWIRGTLPPLPDIFPTEQLAAYARLNPPTNDAAWLATMQSLARWDDVATHLRGLTLDTPARWQAALVAGARQAGQAGHGDAMYAKALAGLTADRSTSSLSEGLTSLVQAGALTPAACSPRLYQQLAGLLAGDRLNVATDASLSVLQQCLPQAPPDDAAAGLAMQAVMRSAYTQDHAAFRRLMQALPLHWLLSPSMASHAVTAKTEPLFWLRAPQAERLAPAQQQQVLTALAQLSMSPDSTQALPALRLLNRYKAVNPEMTSFANALATGIARWAPAQK